ncbi:MAG: hypothetical protein EHJ94_04645 [Deltaproteobacteria bacterium]|nr:MAG: hypothetical protein EHJ94_04645 [Deltaproteobacteria bacterium]
MLHRSVKIRAPRAVVRKELVRYIHLNPLRAGMVEDAPSVSVLINRMVKEACDATRTLAKKLDSEMIQQYSD